VSEENIISSRKNIKRGKTKKKNRKHNLRIHLTPSQQVIRKAQMEKGITIERKKTKKGGG